MKKKIDSKDFNSRSRVRLSRQCREEVNQNGTGLGNSFNLNPSRSFTENSFREVGHKSCLFSFDYVKKRKPSLVKPKPEPVKPVIVKKDTEDESSSSDESEKEVHESNNIKSLTDNIGILSPSVEIKEHAIINDDYDDNNGGHDDKSPMRSNGNGLKKEDSDSDSLSTTSSSLPSPAPRPTRPSVSFQTPPIRNWRIFDSTDDDSDVDTDIFNKSDGIYTKIEGKKTNAGPSVQSPSPAQLARPKLPQPTIVLDKLTPRTISRYSRRTGHGPPLKKGKFETGESEASSKSNLDKNVFFIDSDEESYMKLTNSEVTGNQIYFTEEYVENLVGYVQPNKKMKLFETFPGVKWAPVKLAGDITSGFLTVDPMTVKPFEQPMSKSIIFYVLEGNITVRSSAFQQYGDKRKRYLYGKSIKQGSCIHVPTYTYYTLENRSQSVVRLGYVVVEEKEDEKCP